ncbi:hypothetical protein F5148DRAFT_118524 [Russula earlei]|uniref:Uncharacterized protein n=1 Tax=Russula earlei TaxID=71964 RepID=A0ACC0TRM3_9AGAM|nr:hypothetical protein F5148DRAFT_118524 [Russula earlei]
MRDDNRRVRQRPRNRKGKDQSVSTSSQRPSTMPLKKTFRAGVRPSSLSLSHTHQTSYHCAHSVPHPVPRRPRDPDESPNFYVTHPTTIAISSHTPFLPLHSPTCTPSPPPRVPPRPSFPQRPTSKPYPLALTPAFLSSLARTLWHFPFSRPHGFRRRTGPQAPSVPQVQRPPSPRVQRWREWRFASYRRSRRWEQAASRTCTERLLLPSGTITWVKLDGDATAKWKRPCGARPASRGDCSA